MRRPHTPFLIPSPPLLAEKSCINTCSPLHTFTPIHSLQLKHTSGTTVQLSKVHLLTSSTHKHAHTRMHTAIQHSQACTHKHAHTSMHTQACTHKHAHICTDLHESGLAPLCLPAVFILGRDPTPLLLPLWNSASHLLR